MNRPILEFTDSVGQIVTFCIPSPHTKICCNLSGGADSAILAYMVVDYCEKYIPEAEINFITIANPIKGWYHGAWANKVVDKILHMTNTMMIKSHTIFYRDDQRREEISQIENDYFDKNIATYFLNAVNQNPPLEIEDLLEGRFEARDPDKIKIEDEIYESGFTRRRPFFNCDKRMIKYLYESYQILDELFPYTRSCELPADKGSDGITHCGECWWCRERMWAFGRLC